MLPAQGAKFGDYQANCAMSLGKRLGKPPREIAAQLVGVLDVSDFCEPAEIAGPGFINLRIKDEWLAAQLASIRSHPERLGVATAEKPRTVVIDYSGPNVAKPMHVGHIRSTVIGDALYRILNFLGHRAISDNHLGDWGTQFGMIIYGYKHFIDRDALKRNASRRTHAALQTREFARGIPRNEKRKDPRAGKADCGRDYAIARLVLCARRATPKTPRRPPRSSDSKQPRSARCAANWPACI